MFEFEGGNRAGVEDLETKILYFFSKGTIMFMGLKEVIRWLQMKLYKLKMLVQECTNTYAYKLQVVLYSFERVFSTITASFQAIELSKRVNLILKIIVGEGGGMKVGGGE